MTAGRITPQWIAVDWGTTSLRAWAVGPGGIPLATASSQDGMAALTPEGFEPALLSLIGDWLGEGVTRVVACGMVGARQGWTQAAYRSVPCAPIGPPLTVAPVKDGRIALRIVPGLRQDRPHADVMRGEETQIAGMLLRDAGFDGTVCLPGTHSKWVTVSAGEITGFLTAMTGEIFGLLAGQSVLRHSVGKPPRDDEDLDGAFDEAVSTVLSRPESLAAQLFRIRAEALLQGLTPAAARARLSGLLIGADLAAARPWWLGRQVMLLGEDGLCRNYQRALAAQGVGARMLEAAACTLGGLALARDLWAGPP
jgi:2-dehydro-3-deoxygalactonokinase